jgi:3-hydroxyisobutyrate dehydrogenase-like beta-hydroxyacid dehydrogenase
MKSPSIGFIGFGEAGSGIAAGLRDAGVEGISAFDINVTARILQRAADTKTPLVSTPEELARRSEILLSAVTASSALEAAEQMLPFLGRKHVYLDINSV